MLRIIAWAEASRQAKCGILTQNHRRQINKADSRVPMHLCSWRRGRGSPHGSQRGHTFTNKTVISYLVRCHLTDRAVGLYGLLAGLSTSPVPLAFPLLILIRFFCKQTHRHVVSGRLQTVHSRVTAAAADPGATEGGRAPSLFARRLLPFSSLHQENKSPWCSARDGWCQVFTTPAPRAR